MDLYISVEYNFNRFELILDSLKGKDNCVKDHGMVVRLSWQVITYSFKLGLRENLFITT